MTRPGEAEAVKVALSDPAIARHGGDDLRELRAVVAVVYPVIFAEGVKAGREQAAQDFEALHAEGDSRIWTMRAARIARGSS